MSKNKDSKKYSIISAICFLSLGLYYIINRIINIVQSPSDDNTITIWNIILWVVTIGTAVTIFSKNNIAILTAIGANVLLDTYWFIINPNTENLIYFISYLSLLALLIFTLTGNTIVKKTWYIPSAVFLLECMIVWFEYFKPIYIYYVYVDPEIIHTMRIYAIIFDIVEIVALVFVGLWLKNNLVSKVKTANEYATFNPEIMHSTPASAIGEVDKLIIYKELLESGAITQEEFDTKKEQILKL